MVFSAGAGAEFDVTPLITASAQFVLLCLESNIFENDFILHLVYILLRRSLLPICL